MIAALTPGFVTRFAPAPTGWLHLGHAANALWVWGIARAFHGAVLLRVEDHDQQRCRPEYEQGLLDDLDWLGFTPDGASTDAFRRGTHPQRQRDGAGRYELFSTILNETAEIYPCTCSRREIAAAGGEGAADELRYPGTCRLAERDSASTPARRVVMAPGTEHFTDLRLGEIEQSPAEQCGDLLIRDRHGQWTYQFAVTVDDMFFGVDTIIRGEDLLASTGRQLRLASLLGRAQMPRFVHHPLLRRPDGGKLSKSDKATGLRDLRADGWTPARVLGLVAQLTGLQPDDRPLRSHEVGWLFTPRST